MPDNGEFEEEETLSNGGISKEEKANPDILADEDITQDKDEEILRKSLNECEEVSEENGNTRESKELEDHCTEKLDSSELVEDHEESQLEDGKTDEEYEEQKVVRENGEREEDNFSENLLVNETIDEECVTSEESLEDEDGSELKTNDKEQITEEIIVMENSGVRMENDVEESFVHQTGVECLELEEDIEVENGNTLLEHEELKDNEEDAEMHFVDATHSKTVDDSLDDSLSTCFPLSLACSNIT